MAKWRDFNPGDPLPSNWTDAIDVHHATMASTSSTDWIHALATDSTTSMGQGTHSIDLWQHASPVAHSEEDAIVHLEQIHRVM